MKNSFTATLIFSIIFFSNASFPQIYVSISGDDTNPGTIEQPLQTIPAAVTIAQPGDTIYMRGGTYTLTETIRISEDGTADSTFYLFAYPGERPLLDFSLMAFNSSNRGIILSADYWHVKEIDINGAGDNGMNLSGSNNTIEFCSFSRNRDTGLQLSGGASDNRIINCDSYFNADPGHGNADGFAPKLSVGTNNYFYGCRAWQNSDDGWDGYLRESNDVNTVIENCWCFKNGYLENGSNSNGNGNGYKMGGSDNGNLSHNVTLINSIAFDNRVKGFDQNHNKGSMIIKNCSAYRNQTDYSINESIDSGKTASVVNSLVYGSVGSLGSFVVQQTNSWHVPFVVNTSDFITIDTSGVRSPRKPDGSLPDINFLHLAEGSDLIDAGTDIGLPFSGTKPDLGAFESNFVVSVDPSDNNPSLKQYALRQNYPNPFNPSTSITYQISNSGFVSLKVYDVLGNEVAVLVNETKESGVYLVQFNAENLSADRQDLSSGIYVYTLKQGNNIQSRKMLLVK